MLCSCVGLSAARRRRMSPPLRSGQPSKGAKEARPANGTTDGRPGTVVGDVFDAAEPHGAEGESLSPVVASPPGAPGVPVGGQAPASCCQDKATASSRAPLPRGVDRRTRRMYSNSVDAAARDRPKDKETGTKFQQQVPEEERETEPRRGHPIHRQRKVETGKKQARSKLAGGKERKPQPKPDRTGAQICTYTHEEGPGKKASTERGEVAVVVAGEVKAVVGLQPLDATQRAPFSLSCFASGREEVPRSGTERLSSPCFVLPEPVAEPRPASNPLSSVESGKFESIDSETDNHRQSRNDGQL
ncbi:hypothetical protein CDD83_10505 [Cordyceps sp. RAO-2017]|nr:hypothetical protein CDD83_10505 [Cordyceps sp. RAO-2017]